MRGLCTLTPKTQAQPTGACNTSQAPVHKPILTITNAVLQPRLVNILDSTTHYRGHARVGIERHDAHRIWSDALKYMRMADMSPYATRLRSSKKYDVGKTKKYDIGKAKKYDIGKTKKYDITKAKKYDRH